MKNTLEYKILKYLSESNNDNFANVELLTDNYEVLKSKLISLDKEKLIHFPQPPNVVGIKFEPKLKAKIEFKGIEFLRKMESEIMIETSINDSEIGKLNQESELLLDSNSFKRKTKDTLSSKIKIKSQLITIVSNPFFIGVLLALFTAVLNSEKVMNFINDVLNNL